MVSLTELCPVPSALNAVRVSGRKTYKMEVTFEAVVRLTVDTRTGVPTIHKGTEVDFKPLPPLNKESYVDEKGLTRAGVNVCTQTLMAGITALTHLAEKMEYRTSERFTEWVHTEIDRNMFHGPVCIQTPEDKK